MMDQPGEPLASGGNVRKQPILMGPAQSRLEDMFTIMRLLGMLGAVTSFTLLAASNFIVTNYPVVSSTANAFHGALATTPKVQLPTSFLGQLGLLCTALVFICLIVDMIISRNTRAADYMASIFSFGSGIVIGTLSMTILFVIASLFISGGSGRTLAVTKVDAAAQAWVKQNLTVTKPVPNFVGYTTDVDTTYLVNTGKDGSKAVYQVTRTANTFDITLYDK